MRHLDGCEGAETPNAGGQEGRQACLQGPRSRRDRFYAKARLHLDKDSEAPCELKPRRNRGVQVHLVPNLLEAGDCLGETVPQVRLVGGAPEAIEDQPCHERSAATQQQGVRLRVLLRGLREREAVGELRCTPHFLAGYPMGARMSDIVVGMTPPSNHCTRDGDQH